MNGIEQFAGTYVGSGTWHDDNGKLSSYKVVQTNIVIDDGFGVRFKHDFDDGSVVEACFDMTWLAPFVFRVDASGSAIGNGYVFGNYCHYHLKVGGAFVEASYRSSGESLEVFGSSTRNADGHYIAWSEVLRRENKSGNP